MYIVEAIFSPLYVYSQICTMCITTDFKKRRSWEAFSSTSEILTGKEISSYRNLIF